MSDDLSQMRDALHAAQPAPDPAHRAETLSRAQAAFEKNPPRAQGSADGMRQTSDRPKTGLVRGVIDMLQSLSPKAALGGSSAIALIAAVLFLPLGDIGAPERPAMPASALEVARDRVAPQASVEAIAPDMATDRLVAGAPLSMQAAPQDMRRGLPEPRNVIEPARESFANAAPGAVQITAEAPVSTFSIDVDTASYALVRDMISMGEMPPRDAVRIEEMINYFSYDYPAPNDDTPFSVSLGAMETPWNPQTRLVRIGLQGAQIEARPPLNLVFLIDTSGSMNQPDKLPLLKQSFALMLDALRPEDQIAMVAYAGAAGEVLAPTQASDRAAIVQAFDRLTAGGGTAGAAGLERAYATAQTMADAGEVSRVILATDGDFNLGLSDPRGLEAFIADKRESGTYLSVLGFGRGNLDDATMQALAQAGNGMAAYIDTLGEAQKVLVDQLSGALFSIADDVKVQVEWNPAQVAEYRLIGYETRALARTDFNNDRVDAGEIGAGHQVTALYEITPLGSQARLSDPLRYGAPAAADESGELGFLRLRYKAPGAGESQLIEQAIAPDLGPDADLRFAAAIAGFGEALRGSDMLGDWGLSDAAALARAARGEDRFGYRAEAVRLMQGAAELAR